MRITWGNETARRADTRQAEMANQVGTRTAEQDTTSVPPADSILVLPDCWGAEKITALLDQLRAALRDAGDQQRAELEYPSGGGRIIRVVTS